jgi:hypothetical protein
MFEVATRNNHLLVLLAAVLASITITSAVAVHTAEAAGGSHAAVTTCNGDTFTSTKGFGPSTAKITGRWKWCSNGRRITTITKTGCIPEAPALWTLISYSCKSKNRNDGGYTITDRADFRSPRICVGKICTPSNVLTLMHVVDVSPNGRWSWVQH